jgi:hypothetical protein
MTLAERWNNAKQNPVQIPWKTIVPVLVAVALFAVVVTPSFAQTTTLNLDTQELQNGLFSGANIIIGALAGIMFLLAGFRFGGTILRMIIDTVTGFRF